MQIDFHHAVTYVTARIAGFTHDEASVIAYSAQYVDDAISSGAIVFSNAALYTRISSAHKSLDLQNLDDVENHLVWVPFHFLPGNGGLPAGQVPEGTFINRLICRPDSPPAREMVLAAYQTREKPNALYRLGIAMHVYADTWAHQGFAGVLHDVNQVDDAEDIGGSGVSDGGLQPLLDGILEHTVPPLGHGRANVFPDMPFLAWRYTNGWGQKVTRDNEQIFCEAADALCRAMQEYRRLRDVNVAVTGIGDKDKETLRQLFQNQKSKEGEERHAKWLEAIANGVFTFGKALVSYDPYGRDSWKAKALGTSHDMPVYPYADSFLKTDWKMFHDALQEHRLTVLHDILPKYGICAG